MKYPCLKVVHQSMRFPFTSCQRFYCLNTPMLQKLSGAQRRCEPHHEKICYAICEQQRRRSACASAQSDQRLCCSLPRLYTTSSFYIRNFKPLPSFCGCTGRFESTLVGNPENRFSRDEAHVSVVGVKFHNTVDLLQYSIWDTMGKRSELTFPVYR